MTDYNMNFLAADELKSLGLRGFGKNVFIDASVQIIGTENILIGDNVRIDAGTIIIATGSVIIGSRIHIGAHCYLEGRGGIDIHDYSNVSAYVGLHSVSDDSSGLYLTNPMVPESYKALTIGKITLEEHSILFTKATVLPGVSVGTGAVVGAHSLVTTSVPEWVMYGGTPAQFIKHRRRDLLLLAASLARDTKNVV